MIVLISKASGKYFKLGEDNKTLTTATTLKTASVFPETAEDGLKKLLCNVADKIAIRHLQSTQFQEFVLSINKVMQYNKIKQY